MKKLLAIALIAASFVACNDQAKNEDSTTTVIDSNTTTTVTPMPAPTNMDTSHPAKIDSMTTKMTTTTKDSTSKP